MGGGLEKGGETMTVDVLESFSVVDHERVRAVAQPRELAPGDCLYDQGSVATAAFLVTGGTAAVLAQGRSVGMINAGAILGDADVLGRRTYRTRVEAVTPMTVWEIRAHDLDRLLVDAPTFARALARDLGRRLRAAEMSLAEAS
jgi:CRP-like cAMP-binding protein